MTLLEGVRSEGSAVERALARRQAPRVLMVLKRSGGHGGMQVQALRVAMAMREQGVPVTLVTAARGSRARLGGPAGRGRPSGRGFRASRHGWRRYLPACELDASNRWRFAAELFRFLLRRRAAYDLVHVHGLGLETLAALAARRWMGRPLVVKPSTAGPGTKLDFYARLAERLPGGGALWRGVDAWISISEQTRADLLRLGVPDGRIASIPNGVDTRRFFPLPPAERTMLRAQLGVAPEETVVCAVARLAPHKRVDLLIRAFLEAGRALPEGVGPARLWIVGTGEERARLEALARPAGERIRFWGAVRPDSMPRIFQASDLFALISRWEGLSNALLEAMACGLPPLVSRVSGMTDVVEEGVSGRLVAAEEEAAVAEALRTLLADPAGRSALGEHAAERVRARYGLETTLGRLLGLYRRCLEGGNSNHDGRSG